jgi:hypothetical protein
MRIGPFFFDSKEIFLVLAAVLLSVAFYFKWPLWQFQPEDLLVLVIIFLILKGLLPSVHNEVFFLHAIVAIVLTLFLPLFQVILFYAITFFIFKIMKLI